MAARGRRHPAIIRRRSPRRLVQSRRTRRTGGPGGGGRGHGRRAAEVPPADRLLRGGARRPRPSGTERDPQNGRRDIGGRPSRIILEPRRHNRVSHGEVAMCAERTRAKGRWRGVPVRDLVLLGLLLLGPGPASLVAQQEVLSAVASPSTPSVSSCEIMASVAGGVAGALIGGIVLGRLGRAFYEGEDAGLTGGIAGMVLGAIGGMQLARRACDEPSDARLRRALQQQLPQRMSVTDEGPAETCPSFRVGLCTLADRRRAPWQTRDSSSILDSVRGGGGRGIGCDRGGW